jgi:MFS transporter, UMF1 family
MSDYADPTMPAAEGQMAEIEKARLAQTRSGEGGATGKTGLAWAWFEWARNPYYILIVIYIFAPYFARDIIGGDLLASGTLDGLDPAKARAIAGAQGQATVAGVTKWAGVIAALTAPFLGAAFDRGLKRKPFIFFNMAVMAGSSFMLWWAMPGGAGLSIPMIMGLLILAYVAYTYSEVAHNSMLSDAARPEALPGVSGLGLALGNAAATLMFIAIVLLFALPDVIHWPLKSAAFGIDTSKFEQFRLAGPLCAAWIVLMIYPFFHYAKDTGIKGTPIIPAFRDGVRGVVNTVKRASEHREAFKFLIARTLYADGMAALLAVGAVYVSLFLGWGLIELTVYAIWASMWAVVGGIFGGWLDRRIGPKNALIFELSGIVLIMFYGLSITKETILYGLVPNVEIFDWLYFGTLSDMAYLLQGALIAVFATANISSSRSMVVHVAPPHMRGEFFGLFAIAGTITVWMGPLLIEYFTKWSQDQRIGMSAIALLFFLGLAMLTTINAKDKPAS